MKYSIIVPCYNEAGNVQELQKRIKQTMSAVGHDYEIIFVDDGSIDNTYQKLNQLTDLKIIRFRKNFGQTAALDAGIKEARGEWIITLDGDLQNPPEEIPKLIARQKETGADVVSGWRHERQDPWLKKTISRGANLLRRIFINEGINDSGCSLKLYRAVCFKNLDLFGEIHRFLPGILRWQGFKISEVKVEHAPRHSGRTKYNWQRILKSFVDMIGVWFWRKYSSRPLHLFGGTGFILFSAGFGMGLVLVVLRILKLISLQTTIWPLVSVLLILVGIQLFISGLLAEILIKNYYHGSRTPYNIERIEQK